MENISDLIARHAGAIDQWLTPRAADVILPFYASADIRDAGGKCACVDLNLFPAGFNNLCERSCATAVEEVRRFLDRRFGGQPHRRVLLVPEAHSRNPFYNAHLRSLRDILAGAGLEVTIAAVAGDDGVVPHDLLTHDGIALPAIPVQREQDVLTDAHALPGLAQAQQGAVLSLLSRAGAGAGARPRH
jgi:glutamate--cysteine ligase